MVERYAYSKRSQVNSVLRPAPQRSQPKFEIFPESEKEFFLTIRHVHHIPALDEELHHLLAGARQLRPPGFRIRVLFQPSNRFAIEDEVHLPQLPYGSPPDGVMLRPEFDRLGVLDESVPPDLDELSRKSSGRS